MRSITVAKSTPDCRAIWPSGSVWNPCTLSSDTARMRALIGSWTSTGIACASAAVLMVVPDGLSRGSGPCHASLLPASGTDTLNRAMKPPRDETIIAAGAAALFVASFVVFWPALRGEFLWDDTLNITGNPLVRSPRGLLDIWRGSRPMYDYYPLTWTTWWLEWRAWRKD